MAMKNLDTHGNYIRATICVGYSTYIICRWERRVMPYWMEGGSEREKLAGADHLLLCICIFVSPEATSDQIAVFIHSSGGDIYSQS